MKERRPLGEKKERQPPREKMERRSEEDGERGGQGGAPAHLTNTLRNSDKSDTSDPPLETAASFVAACQRPLEKVEGLFERRDFSLAIEHGLRCLTVIFHMAVKTREVLQYIPRLLLVVARSHVELGQPSLALELFDHYLRLSCQQVQDDKFTAAVAEFRACASAVGDDRRLHFAKILAKENTQQRPQNPNL